MAVVFFVHETNCSGDTAMWKKDVEIMAILYKNKVQSYKECCGELIDLLFVENLGQDVNIERVKVTSETQSWIHKL